jgi:uncharacterized coiled-coil protein SlyX
MPTLEERVAYLEGQVSEQSHALVDIRDAIRHADGTMQARFDEMNHRFTVVDHRFTGIDRRFDAIDRRFEVIDQRFEAVDRRFDAVDRRFDAVDRRFDGLSGRVDVVEDKMSRQFAWIVGVQVTTFVAIVGAIIARG